MTDAPLEPAERQEEYLGDGCYVCVDAGDIRLRAPREGGDHVIYLNPHMLNNLLEYVARVRPKP